MLAQRISRIEEPQTILMAKMSRALKEEGKDVIDLSLGEPDFDTPNFIKEAAKDALNMGLTKYPPVAGTPALRQAICDKFKRENNLDFTIENIVVSAGAKHSIANAVLALVEEGDEAVIPTPYWVTYSEIVKFAGGTVKFIHTNVEQKFKITPAQLDAALTNKSKIFIFSSPSNPTGELYSYEELEALVSIFEKYPNVVIISDEIYEYINFKGKHISIAEFPILKNRIIIINGISKGFAMTGWRLGYIAAPAPIAKACELIQSQFTSGVNSITQYATIAALNGSHEEMVKMKEAFLNRKNLVIVGLKSIEGIKVSDPEGAFYAFPDVSYYLGKKRNGKMISNTQEMCLDILSEVLVSTVTGIAFGSANCIRISYATNEENLIKAMDRLKKYFSEFNN